jgi:hypothetical protein
MRQLPSRTLSMPFGRRQARPLGVDCHASRRAIVHET